MKFVTDMHNLFSSLLLRCFPDDSDWSRQFLHDSHNSCYYSAELIRHYLNSPDWKFHLWWKYNQFKQQCNGMYTHFNRWVLMSFLSFIKIVCLLKSSYKSFCQQLLYILAIQFGSKIQDFKWLDQSQKCSNDQE